MSPQWAAMSERVPHDPEHELEWTIIAESIDEDELQRLRELHSVLDDCDLHPVCRRKPLHRQAQTLLRYLRGRDGNVRKAEKMFRDMIDWRESFDVENKVHSWRRELERGLTRRARLCKMYGVEDQMCNDKYGIPATRSKPFFSCNKTETSHKPANHPMQILNWGSDWINRSFDIFWM